MIDFARITVKSGSGGQGAGSFFHIKGKRYGKADGGDGGNGANVLLETTQNLNTLEPFRYIKDYKARNGENGLSNRRRGADGEDLVIRVPVGTTVNIVVSEPNRGTNRNYTRNQAESYDLVELGQRVLVARGGRGGRGNAKLRDELGRRPRAGEVGEEGEEQNLTLELKLIADVGLIGLPNAGKSTLLAALTKATPKIADYPFTTLEPNLGVLDSSWLMVDGSLKKPERKTINDQLLTINKSAKLILADIPGLIEGASQGKGLGDLFLRHIERTKVLVHLVDVSTIREVREVQKAQEVQNATGKAVEKLWEDYQTVRNELKAYSSELAKKKEIIVLNKIDSQSDSLIQNAKAIFATHRKKVIAISAKEGVGLEELVREILKSVNKI